MAACAAAAGAAVTAGLIDACVALRPAQVQGNEAVKRGSAFYQRQAAAFYTQAIEQRSGNAEQNSVYYANRAHTQLQLRNWGKALADARAAVALNAANVKVRRCGALHGARLLTLPFAGMLSGCQGGGGAGQARGRAGAVRAGAAECVAPPHAAFTEQV